MSTRLREKEEKILQVLERLADESRKGKPIIVEGKKDIDALRAFGLEGQIISAKTAGKAFLDVLSEVEKCGTREVVLLLDFDRRGKEWTQRLKQQLEKMGITPNTRFWHELLNLLSRDIRDVESLTNYMKTLRRKLNDLS